MQGKKTFPLRCLACGSTELLRGARYTNGFWPRLSMFEGLEIAHCSGCGFGFSWPELDDDQVGLFYQKNYRERESPFYLDISRLGRSLAPDYRSLAQLLLAKQYVSFRSGDCFLDIGPGGGQSFASANRVFARPDCAAIELNEGAAKAYSREYGISTYDSATAFLKAGKRATVCLLSHTLEHYKLSWLEAGLAELQSVLSPDGVAVVEVPLLDMRIHSELRFEDAPHFLFFSLPGIRALFENHGWEILYANSAAETYAEWLPTRSPRSTSVIRRNTRFSGLRTALRKSLSALPGPVRRILRNRLREPQIDFTNPQFSYGGDRTCLRVVARPRA